MEIEIRLHAFYNDHFANRCNATSTGFSYRVHGMKWITNGTKERYISQGEEIPEGLDFMWRVV